MKALIIAVIASIVFAGYAVNEAFSAMNEFRVATVNQTQPEQVIYGHRIGPGGQEMILTSR